MPIHFSCRTYPLLILRLFITGLLIILFTLSLSAQYTPCFEYAKMMRTVRQEMAKKDFAADLVFKKLRTARVLVRDCDERDAVEIDATLQKLFKLLEKERDEAKAAQKKANLERLRANTSKEAAVAAREEANLNARAAITAKEEARKQADIAEAVLDKIYFYEGEFGMATEGSGNALRFGFINKQLETKITFKYSEALPFDDLGFAKVKYRDEYYLIDTSGQKYLLRTDISIDEPRRINNEQPEIKVLDLRDKYVRSLLDVAAYYPDLEILITPNVDRYHIDGIHRLDSLKSIFLNGNVNLTSIDALANLTNLHSLDLSRNRSLKSIDALANLTNLHSLVLSVNSILTDIDILANLTNLHSLELSAITNLTDLDFLEKLTNLRSLDLSRNSNLTNIDGLKNLTSLQFLDLSLNKSLSSIDFLSNLTKLKKLKIGNTNIPKAKIKELEKALPNCEIISD